MNRPVLTSRELEIMTLLVKGMSSKDMANDLFISKRTVEFHITNLMGKFGVNTRMKLILAYQLF
jgi:DNA-binding NarL/FixJ family response regulator